MHGAVQLTADAGAVDKGSSAQGKDGEKPARNSNHITNHKILEISAADYRMAVGGVNKPLRGIDRGVPRDRKLLRTGYWSDLVRIFNLPDGHKRVL